MANNDLLTRLLLDSKNFDTNLAKSTKQVKEFQNMSKKVGSTFNSGLGVLTKFAPQLAALGGSVAAFNKTINSSETLIDAWGRNMNAASASVDRIFQSIAQGDFTNFIDGLKSVITNAKEAYNAIDALGTLTAFQDADLTKIQTKRLDVQLRIKEAKKKGLDTTELYNELIGYDDQIEKMAREKADVAANAYNAELLKTLGGQSVRVNGTSFKISDDYIMEMAHKWADSWDNGDGTGFKFIEQAVEDAKKKVKELEDSWDTWGKNNAMTWTSQLVNAEKELKILEKIKDNEAKITEHKNYQKIAEQAKQSSLQARLQSVRFEENATKETANNLKKANEYYKEITKNAKKFKDFIKGGGNYDIFNLSSNSFSNLFNDSKIINAIDNLSDDFVSGLADAFDEFSAKQELNNKLLENGTKTEEQWQKSNLENQDDLFRNLQKLAENGVLTQEKAALQEVVIPALGSLSRVGSDNSEFDTKTKNQISVWASNYKFGKEVARNLGNWGSTLFSHSDSGLQLNKSAFYGGGDVEAKINGFIDLQIRLKDKIKEVNHEIMAGGSERVINSLQSVADSYEGQIAVLETMIQLMKGFKEEFDFQDNFRNTANSLTLMSDSVASVFQAAGKSEAAFVMQTLGDLSNLMAQLANVAITAGVSSAAQLPYPYNLAAIATSVATISGIVASAMQTFADGGIVQGGSFSGDKGMVRVNAGEMILNGSQQANLFRLLNNGGSVYDQPTGQVEFKLRGQELVGLMKNTTNRNSKLL